MENLQIDITLNIAIVVFFQIKYPSGKTNMAGCKIHILCGKYICIPGPFSIEMLGYKSVDPSEFRAPTWSAVRFKPNWATWNSMKSWLVHKDPGPYNGSLKFVIEPTI